MCRPNRIRKTPAADTDCALRVGRKGDDRAKRTKQRTDSSIGQRFTDAVKEMRGVRFVSIGSAFRGIAEDQRPAHAHAVKTGQETNQGQQPITHVATELGHIRMIHIPAIEPKNKANPHERNRDRCDLFNATSKALVRG